MTTLAHEEGCMCLSCRAAAMDWQYDDDPWVRRGRGDHVERDALLAEIGKGCCVYRHGDGLTEPPGGVVVGVDHEPDQETGEVRRVFHTMTWFRGEARTHVIPAADVDLETLQPLNTKAVRDLMRNLAKAVAAGKGAMKPEHRRYVQVMEDLGALLR